MAGDKYDGGADDYSFKEGGCKSQLVDYNPGNYIVLYQPTEDPPSNVNRYGKISGSF